MRVDLNFHEPRGAPPLNVIGTIGGVVVVLSGRSLSDEKRRQLLEALATLPFLARDLAPHGTLQVINLSEEEFSSRFPKSSRAGESFFLRPGRLYLNDASRWGDLRIYFMLHFEEIRQKFEYVLPKDDYFSWRDELLVPTDFRVHAQVLANRFVSQGFRFESSEYFRMDVGLVQTSGEGGLSANQVRVRTTNPRFNQWAQGLIDPLMSQDPGIKFYAGFFTAVANHPRGVAETLSWGADARLTAWGGTLVYWDANLQHRVRTSGSFPSDQFAIENSLRVKPKGKGSAFGATVTATPFADPKVRTSLNATFRWK